MKEELCVSDDGSIINGDIAFNEKEIPQFIEDNQQAAYSLLKDEGHHKLRRLTQPVI